MWATVRLPTSEFAGVWAVGAGILIFAFFALRGTTLQAATVWCLVGWAGYLGLLCGYGDSQYCYLLAVAAILPVLAALGAKRPQNVAWQLIVITLAGVMLMPIVRGWAMRQSVSIHPLLGWLLAAHTLLGVGNYIVTRYWASAIVYGASASLAAGPWLPIPMSIDETAIYYSLGGFVVAMAGAYLVSRRSRTSPTGIDRLWRDFRDAYGVVWGLRVAERFNVAARRHRWPVELTWRGFVATDGSAGERSFESLEPEQRHRIERELRSYLRRFVSHGWIARRMPAHEAPAAESKA